MSYYLKSWIKLGFRFCVSKKIKKLWQKNPQLFLAEIYDLNFRKFSNKRRFNLMKKLLKNSKDQNLANFVLGKLAFKIGFYQQSIEILQALSLQHPSQRIYQIIAKSHQLLGNDSENQKNLTLAKNFTKS
jgi:uncharacterized protein HemY